MSKSITIPRGYQKIIEIGRGTDIVFKTRIPRTLFRHMWNEVINYTIFYHIEEIAIGYVLELLEWNNDVLDEINLTGRSIFGEITHIEWLGTYLMGAPRDKWGIITFKEICRG